MAHKILLKKSKLVISPSLIGTDIDRMLRQFYQYQGITYIDADRSWILMELDYKKYLEYCDKNYIDETMLFGTNREIQEFMMKVYYKYLDQKYHVEETREEASFSLYDWLDDENETHEIEFKEIEMVDYDEFYED